VTVSSNQNFYLPPWNKRYAEAVSQKNKATDVCSRITIERTQLRSLALSRQCKSRRTCSVAIGYIYMTVPQRCIHARLRHHNHAASPDIAISMCTDSCTLSHPGNEVQRVHGITSGSNYTLILIKPPSSHRKHHHPDISTTMAKPHRTPPSFFLVPDEKVNYESSVRLGNILYLISSPNNVLSSHPASPPPSTKTLHDYHIAIEASNSQARLLHQDPRPPRLRRQRFFATGKERAGSVYDKQYGDEYVCAVEGVLESCGGGWRGSGLFA
jgi:hypothetical protein